MHEGTRAAVARERIREPGPGPEPRPRAPGRITPERSALHVLAPFPRPVPTFVGRSDELVRAHGLLARAPALLVYGVPGIGKSEFVYRLIDELREDPAWRRARPVLLQAQRGQSAAALVSLLRLALDGPRRSPLHPGAAPRPHAGSEGDGPSAQALADLVHALELRPHLVFLDDAHHLEEGALLALLGYLSRRVSRSRILVASRAELPLSPEGPLPAVIRLPPLEAAETSALASQLVERLGLEPLPGDVFGVTRGSPYHVQRVLMRSRGLPVSGEDPLLVTLRGLSPAARRLLLLCRILSGRMGELLGEGLTELPAVPELDELRSAQWELGRYFLVQAPRYTVHELVWEAVAPAFSPEDHVQAHRTAARLCLDRAATGREPAPDPQPLDVLAAMQHLLACGDGAAAWSIFVSSRRLLTAPSLEPLTLAVLAELQQTCPEHAEDVVIFCAKLLLRQGRIGEARARLAALQRERGGLPALGGQALRLVGHAAARAGELAAAAESVDAACRASPSDPAVRLERAWLAALQGEHELAVSRLAEAALLAAAPLERARLLRHEALCALLAERPAGPHVAAALALLPALPTEHRAAEEGALALIELALRCAEGDLPGARRALDRILFHGALMSGPPEPLQDLGRGALLLAEGAVPAAQLQLLRAHEALQQRGEQLLVLVTELLLGACGLRSGADAEALGRLEEARRRAARTGARPLERIAEALRAQALLAGRELSAAGQAATAVLAAGASGPGGPASAWARLVACGVKVQLAVLHGDRAGAEQALARQAQTATELASPAAAWCVALVRAELAALLEPPAQALVATETARACFRTSGQRHELARAELAHALACARHGGDGPLLACAESIEAVNELGAAGGYLPLLLGAALCEAALAQRRGESRRAAELLRRALEDSPAAGGGVAALPLRAALDPALRAPAGVRLLLASLGLHAEPAVEVTDRSGARIVPAAGAADARPTYDLIVDVDRGLLGTPDAAARVSGRPLLCLILARLLAARADGSDSVDAERLFYDVWGGREYNPLRHRNTIYVAITRLRQALRDVLPGREVVETTPSGWRLAPGIELCVRRALR